MAGNTPIYNFPYPTGSDPVSQGDNAIKALAEDVETVISNNVAGLVYVSSGSSSAPSPSETITGFSGTYDSYRLILSCFGAPIAIRAQAQGSSGAFNDYSDSAFFSNTSGATGISWSGNGSTSFGLGIYNPTATDTLIVDFHRVNSASRIFWTGQQFDSTNLRNITFGGRGITTGQVTSINIVDAGGLNFIAVWKLYGYKQ